MYYNVFLKIRRLNIGKNLKMFKVTSIDSYLKLRCDFNFAKLKIFTQITEKKETTQSKTEKF